MATVVGLAFVVLFLDAFHAPEPHALPVGVVGSARQVAQVRAALTHAMPGQFAGHPLAGQAEARAAVLQDDVERGLGIFYGAFGVVLGGFLSGSCRSRRRRSWRCAGGC